MPPKSALGRNLGGHFGGRKELTLSLGRRSGFRPGPPGVKLGLKETARFAEADMEVAAGTTSFCTGG